MVQRYSQEVQQLRASNLNLQQQKEEVEGKLVSAQNSLKILQKELKSH